MSSAELQSLMSQLQAQRQDPYLHATTAANILTYDDSVGQMFWYPDGTPGDRENGKDGEHKTANMTISEYDPTIFFDKDKKRQFTKWKHEPRNADDGRIIYDECDMQDMALMIAWEKMLKNRARRELTQSKQKVVKLQKQLADMKHEHTQGHAHGKGESSMTTTTYPDGRVTITKGYAKETKAAQEPHKKKKKPKMATVNPDDATQRAIFNKSQNALQERYRNRKDGKIFKRKEFFPREPGTFGPLQKTEPYQIG